MISQIAAALLFLAPGAVLAGEITAAPGDYEVLDGGSIRIGLQTLNLQHIAAPAMNTPCRMRGRMRDCGLISRSQLMDLTVATPVKCSTKIPANARCTAAGFDLAEQMVYTGWAVPITGAPARYWKQMEGAQAKKRGFWNAEFSPPWAPQIDALKRLP